MEFHSTSASHATLDTGLLSLTYSPDTSRPLVKCSLKFFQFDTPLPVVAEAFFHQQSYVYDNQIQDHLVQQLHG